MSGVGEILKAVGDFGRLQKCLVLLSVIPCLSVAFHQFCQLFMVPSVPYHCDTSWIRAVGPNLTEEEQLNLTLPRGADGQFEQCSMYSPVDWDLDSILAYGLNDTQKCSNGWVYPSAQPPSLLTEVCICYLMCWDVEGMGHPNGHGSPRAAGDLGSSTQAPDVVLERVQAVIEPSFFPSATEWIGVSSRPKAVLTSHCCFAIGQMILAGLSYGIRNWRLLEIAGSVPIFTFFFFISSVRAVSEEVAAAQNQAGSFPLECRSWRSCCTAQHISLGSMLHFHMSNTCSVPPCLAFRFVNSFVYYGLSLNVTNFGLDIYLTQLAFGAVEIPARIGCIFTLQRFGRRKTQTVLLVLSGLVCLVITGIPEALPVPWLAGLKGQEPGCPMAWGCRALLSAPAGPVSHRQTGVGLCSMAARVAGILAPLVRLLGQYHRAIPMAIFGSAPVLGGLLCVLLPETRGTELADDTGDSHPPAEVGLGACGVGMWGQ
uniref:Solute carrier family 22 member 13 n=1 Tax=Catharus ustulatus TaxID=91951 RepID=A0A8C3XXV7_CATUS